MKPAGQMTLTLTSELEHFVREKVKHGSYASSSEYVRDLVRDRYLKERQQAARNKLLDAALEKGLTDVEAGRTIPLDLAFERLRQELGLPEGRHE